MGLRLERRPESDEANDAGEAGLVRSRGQSDLAAEGPKSELPSRRLGLGRDSAERSPQAGVASPAAAV